MPDGPVPAFGVYLLGRRPPAVPWESRWLRWPDLRLPAVEAEVLPTLTEAWQRAATERVEIACAGGHGRTGTALACLAILDGVPSTEAVAFVREHYDPHAVGLAFDSRYRRHGNVSAVTVGYHRTQCRAILTRYTSHLVVEALSGYKNGKVRRRGELKRVY